MTARESRTHARRWMAGVGVALGLALGAGTAVAAESGKRVAVAVVDRGWEWEDAELRTIRTLAAATLDELGVSQFDSDRLVLRGRLTPPLRRELLNEGVQRVLVVDAGRLGHALVLGVGEFDLPSREFTARSTVASFRVAEADEAVPELVRGVVLEPHGAVPAPFRSVPLRGTPMASHGEFQLGAGMAAPAPLALSLGYEADRWRVAGGMVFGPDGDGAANLDAAWLADTRDLSPFVAAGFGYVERDGYEGTVARAGVGVELFRHHPGRVLIGANLLFPLEVGGRLRSEFTLHFAVPIFSR